MRFPLFVFFIFQSIKAQANYFNAMNNHADFKRFQNRLQAQFIDELENQRGYEMKQKRKPFDMLHDLELDHHHDW